MRCPEEGVKRVGHTLHLLDFAAVDEAEGEDAAVGGREEGRGIGV